MLFSGISARGLIPRNSPVFVDEWLKSECRIINKKRLTMDRFLYIKLIEEEFETLSSLKKELQPSRIQSLRQCVRNGSIQSLDDYKLWLTKTAIQSTKEIMTMYRWINSSVIDYCVYDEYYLFSMFVINNILTTSYKKFFSTIRVYRPIQ